MKYKVGDKVEVIGTGNGHGFNIGEVVTITELFPDGNPPHYRANSNTTHWYLRDEHIKPYKEETKMDLSKYNTKPIDFTGCHPAIAEALKQGLMIECEVWDCNKKESEIQDVWGWDSGRKQYRSDMYYLNAAPISKKRKVLKPLAECIRLLLEDGWEFSPLDNSLQRSKIEPCNKIYPSAIARLQGGGSNVVSWPSYLFEEVE